MVSGHLAWRSSLVRRGLFQVHLWLGVAVGLYLCVVSLTGAALVFRIDLQRAVHPDLLLPAGPGIQVDSVTIADTVAAAYPTGRLVGVDAPTTSRPVYLAYVTDDAAFRTVLADPSNGRVLGELPDESPIRTLQELHFNLLTGDTGLLINGAGAICLTFLALTGAVIWWPGRSRWARGLSLRWRGNAERRVWELHGAIGIWSVLLIALWAVTALSFTFPKQFRATVNAISPISARVQPKSSAGAAAEKVQKPTLRELVQRAQGAMSAQHVARVVLPAGSSDPVQVLFSERRPTPAGNPNLTPLYLDQYSGDLLTAAQRTESAGDKIMAWVGPLHVGGFGGLGVKVIWLCFGLAPAALFVTGFITWWRRVLRPIYARAQSGTGVYESR